MMGTSKIPRRISSVRPTAAVGRTRPADKERRKSDRLRRSNTRLEPTCRGVNESPPSRGSSAGLDRLSEIFISDDQRVKLKLCPDSGRGGFRLLLRLILADLNPIPFAFGQAHNHDTSVIMEDANAMKQRLGQRGIRK